MGVENNVNQGLSYHRTSIFLSLWTLSLGVTQNASAYHIAVFVFSVADTKSVTKLRPHL